LRLIVLKDFDVSCATSVSFFSRTSLKLSGARQARKITVFRNIMRIFAAMFRRMSTTQQQVLQLNGLMAKIIATINKNEKS
jgi:hypothetical protein